LYVYDDGMHGRAIMRSASAFSFSCSDDSAEFAFSNGFVDETWVVSPVPGESQLVRRLNALEAVTYRPADSSRREIALWRISRHRASFPDRPELGSQVSTLVSLRNARLNQV